MTYNSERKLTPQQQIFVNEYLDHFDVERAAREAGYTEGYHEMIASTPIQAALAEEIKKRIGKGQVSEEKVLIEIGKIAFASMSDFVSWSNDGVKIKDSKMLSEELASCVQNITISPTGAMKITLYDKKPALELLTRHFGMLKDKVEHFGKIEHEHYKYEEYTKEELQKEATKLAGELEAIANADSQKSRSRNSSPGNGHKEGTGKEVIT